MPPAGSEPLKMNYMKKLILFDLDGTLLDTIEDLGDAVNHSLQAHGLPVRAKEEFPAMVGHGVRNLVKNALPQHLKEDTAVLDSCLKDFVDYYSSHIDIHTKPYDGITELLHRLNSRNIKLAVVSNKFQKGAEKLVGKFFGDIAFVCILGNRPGHPLKPDPAIVEEVLSAADMKKEDCVLVGDSLPDMLTAANSGIDAIAVSWGYCKPSELSLYRIAGNTEELESILLR